MLDFELVIEVLGSAHPVYSIGFRGQSIRELEPVQSSWHGGSRSSV